ncbi:hypothetical protein MAR_013370 [Mya arenaria]|uniref:CUB domain-containing protein n=1 Tax=Mya arenaria TaxID=6604 RepID=A0ABY7G3Q4_MYAAR|nr:hypothetical protein MAR_013370 [Mya arenaria]
MAIEFTVEGYLSASFFTQESASGSPPSCGGTFVERRGSLSSPNNPSSFNENQACLYNISVTGVLSVCLEIEYIHDVRLVLEVTEIERSHSSRDSAGTKVTRKWTPRLSGRTVVDKHFRKDKADICAVRTPNDM